jgi:hypothetical protein
MGLSLTVGGKNYGSWSYSGFNEFRRKLAKEIGLNLGDMEGFHNISRDYLEDNGWEAYRNAIEADYKSEKKIKWETIDDPIKELLNHSDSEGMIKPELCGAIANRLEELIKSWPLKIQLTPPDSMQKHLGYPPQMEIDDYDVVQAKLLISGLREAVILNKSVEFH